MFLAANTTYLAYVWLMLLIRVSPLPLDNEEGTVDSDNPKIEEEDEEIVDPNVWFSEDLYDGDIVLSDEQKRDFQSGPLVRSGLISNKYRWPKTTLGKFVIIPYIFGNDPGYTPTQKAIIRQSMNDIEKYTCIRFRNRTGQKDYIRIYSGSGCHSPVGKIGGQQSVSLSRNGCIHRNIIVHELIHAIGFNHMHQRFDRDNYITVMWQNIKEKNKFAFLKKDNKYEAFNTKYDYLSCMHYRKTGVFSKNGKNTIFTKDPAYLDRIGNVATLSKGDARRINRMYKCPV